MIQTQKPRMNLMLNHDEKGNMIKDRVTIRDVFDDQGTLVESAVDRLKPYGPIMSLGERHVPLPFEEQADMTFRVLRERGFNPHGAEFHLTHNLQRMFAAFYLGKTFEGVGDIELVGIMRGSYDQSSSAADALGYFVTMCANLSMFSGDLLNVSHRNTRHAAQNLRDRFELAANNIEREFVAEGQRIERLQGWNISPRWADHLTVKMSEAKVFPWSDIPKVLGEYHEPTEHETGVHEPGTAWSLENAVTQHLKPRFAKNPADGAKRTERMVGTWIKALEAVRN